jgi:hypothetical protein
MKIKVWEMVDTNNDMKWYELYDRQNDYQNSIYNNGYEEINLPEGYELTESESGKLYIYKNGFAYSIHKGKTGYMLYPAILTIHEAYEQKRIVYI